MAINIFSGGSGGKTRSGSNRAAQSDRARQARSALSPTSEVSASGNTAVESKGTLGKIGNFIGKAAGVASKFLPGLGGTIAGAVSNLFNDPEWWQSVPGDALTLNETLRPNDIGIYQYTGAGPTEKPALSIRTAILEFIPPTQASNNGAFPAGNVMTLTVGVCQPTERMITQYLMPEIRKVVNAVPLQDAADYNTAFKSAATLYALWRQLKKYDYMCKHGQTYLASMNQPEFPLFTTAKASWLQSTINRLEEYLRANVRLPHTLCEYLAWRYGRVYKSNDSVKSALVIYDVIPITHDDTVWDKVILDLMNQVASDPQVQKANTDLYNTYYDHDYLVEIRDDTQYRFDKKEFMLRLNLTGTRINQSSTVDDPQYVFNLDHRSRTVIDSALDNPTAFMASTVSQVGADSNGNPNVLFPVGNLAVVYIPKPSQVTGSYTILNYLQTPPPLATTDDLLPIFSSLSYYKLDSTGKGFTRTAISNSEWMYGTISMDIQDDSADPRPMIKSLMLSKAVDLYNFGCFIPLFNSATFTEGTEVAWIDLSALSIDAGAPSLTTIATEQVYAFANLVSISRKHSLSYKQGEHLVARDVANMLDTVDVAAMKS